MNKKNNISYICHSCGVISSKWSGRCGGCNEWGSIEEVNSKTEAFLEKQTTEKALKFEKINFNDEIDDSLKNSEKNRIKTAIPELDNLLGGGFAIGSVILIGGEPGIGKSTLLLQIAQIFSSENLKAFYVSGEESILQIKIRMSRLKKSKNLKDDESVALNLISSTSLEEIIASTMNVIGFSGESEKKQNIDLLIIDSIQTVCSERINSGMGSIAQVKICTHELVKLAKQHNIITILVGHITKDGEIAGPKFLEHMVDTVLYFEGEQNYRILRSVKNRYGASGEIAIFEMTNAGLKDIINPSMFFLKNYNKNVSGSVIFSGMEGSRPIMVEIQALIATSYMSMPRRASVGCDLNRLSIILAVLSARCKIILGDKEVYLNVVGGLKLADPSADLAVCAALLSVYYQKIIPEKTIIFGEIGLGGEVRNVRDSSKRIKEAIKLGFKNIFMPNQEVSRDEIKGLDTIEITKISYLSQLMELLKK